MTKSEILNKVTEMLNNVDDEKPIRLSFNDIEDKICLRSTIKNILKESKNEKLNAYLNKTLNDLSEGKTESMLYESFISAVSNWNYLNAVDTELSALASRVDKYKQEIDLSKILNTMKSTSSAYIVPVIEECVLDYVNDKTSNNRVVLTDRLMAFHYDPFVKDMLEVIHCDRSIYESMKYNAKNTNNLEIEKVYSPIYSISESECIFNVNGTYYTKKGNNISRISKLDSAKLDENFKALCNFMNSKNVRINEQDNIELTYGDKVAVISESNISINGINVSNNDIENAKGQSYLVNDGYVNFYNYIQYLKENYNSIAYLDFAKHLKSNINENCLDFFKLKNSYYLTTHDNVGNHTFYRNINPIQTVNIMNEHMNTNVSSMFEELQPDQKKIKNEIDETKKSYEDYINELEERKTKLESCKEGLSDDDAKDVDEALKIVEDELEKVKNDYKEYQKTSDDFLNGGDSDNDSDYSTDEPTDGDNPDDSQDDVNIDNVDNDNDSIDTSDVESPILSISSNNNDLASGDIFDYDPYFDETSSNTEDEYAPKVVKVSYQSNIKTGQVSNQGEVHILIPSVNANGDVTNELQKITFMLDSERNPIINNEYMPVSIYNLIKTAIETEPMTQEVDINTVQDVQPVQQDTLDDIDMGDNDFANVDTDATDNVIDNIYGTDDIETEAPDANPEDIKNDIENSVDVIEPEATDDPEPMDLEASNTIGQIIDINVSEDELRDENVSVDRLKAFLQKQRIMYTFDNGMFKIVIRNSEDADKFRRFFEDFEGWENTEFFTYFNELKIFESYNPSKVVVKYSAKLENILENNNLSYKISKRGDKMMIMNAINEGVLITVTDDKTGKTIKINTDELNDNSEAEEHEENTNDDVTFDDSENANSTENTNEVPAEEDKEGENKNESTEERPETKKKFTFRIKKQKTDESLGLKTYSNKLNEMHETPEVMDVVKYKGKTGHVISKLNNGELIVEVGGHTEIIRPSQIRIVNTDFVKNDDLNESECVNCGIFMNGFCITPTDCLTDKKLYESASDEDLVTLIIEGSSQQIAKKYTKILS